MCYSDNKKGTDENMKNKRTVSILLVIAIILGNISFVALASSAGLFNFKKVNTSRINGQFYDVKKDDWFYPYVTYAYEYDLVKGTGAGAFNPYGEITVAETIALASRIHSIYHNARSDFAYSSPWYRSYVGYALDSNIIANEYSNYDAKLTRAEFASILSKALPDSEFNKINNISLGSLPDVPRYAEFAYDIYKLYNAGILTGNDNYGTFAPQSTIQRCEVSTILARMIDITLRRKVNLEVLSDDNSFKKKLTAEEISNMCSSSVFYVEIYGFNGRPTSSGSGFFISEDGLAITNFHVVANSSYLEIMTTDGKVYNDIKIIDYDRENDLALIKVEGRNFNYLDWDSNFNVKQGQTVYAIGSPEGLSNTLSQGIISNPVRKVNGIDCIQISVPINHGSSGGALINEYGDVIGVTTSGLDTGGDLNFAVPVHWLENLDMTSEEDYVVWDEEYYSGFNRVLDFEHFSGMTLIDYFGTDISHIEVYSLEDFYDAGPYKEEDNFSNTFYYYTKALEVNGMYEVTNNEDKIKYNSYEESVQIDFDYEKGSITVSAMKIPEYYDMASLVIDFGWYSGIPLKSGPYYIGENVPYIYKWSNYYSYEDIMKIIAMYGTMLIGEGFEFIPNEKEDGTIEFLFNNSIYIVRLIVNEENVSVYIKYA